jgi:hypothetical protein
MKDSPPPESLSTLYAVVLAHAMPVCALATATNLAKSICKRNSGLHFRPNQLSRSPIRSPRWPNTQQWPLAAD